MTIAYAPDTCAAPLAINDIMDRLSVRKTFAKGEEIFGQDGTGELIHYVARGAVRTTRLTADGRRQVGDFYYAGDLIGLGTGAARRFCAEALTDCVVQTLRRAALRDLDDPEIDLAFWEATRRELERAQDHVMVLGRKTAFEKVACFLMDLARRHDAGEVPMPMGRQDMADYLGLTIETVSRMVSQLQGERMVLFTGSRRFRVTGWPELERLAA